MDIIFSIPYDRKFYKLTEIICLLAHLLRCTKGLIYATKPLMRLVSEPSDFKDWSAQFCSIYFICGP